MGQNFSSEPVIEKETERDNNDLFNVAVASCQGWRVSQEDNHSMMLDLPGEHKAAFFAVFDGHGSARVSKHASEDLWRHLVENENYLKGNYKEALEQAFLTFDHEVNESYNAQLAGTTAVCLLIVEDKIYCANIGDSRAVACINCECVPLSYDHKPENPQELKRILAAGGYVLGNRVNGNLALSRAFGDFHYKGNDSLPADQQIVSPFPDVKTIDLTDDVDFIVLACDGIWDVLSSEEVVEFIINRLESDMELGKICEQLTTRCLATDYELVIGCDNMTVMIVCHMRDRNWIQFTTDIFNKHSRGLRGPREKKLTTHDFDQSDASNLNPEGEPSSTTTTTITKTETETKTGATTGEAEQFAPESKQEKDKQTDDVASQISEQNTEAPEVAQPKSSQNDNAVSQESKEASREEVEGQEEAEEKKEEVIDKSDDCAKGVENSIIEDSKTKDEGQIEDDTPPRCLVKVKGEKDGDEQTLDLEKNQDLQAGEESSQQQQEQTNKSDDDAQSSKVSVSEPSDTTSSSTSSDKAGDGS